MSAAFRESLVSYLSANFGVAVTDATDDLPLFSSQLLDSFSMIDLVTFIEKGAKVKFGILDLTLDNLDSIGRIMAFVERRSDGKK